MKLKFDPKLTYQKDAIETVVSLFRGQQPMQSAFTVSLLGGQSGLFESRHGVGNHLELTEEQILANLQTVQIRNGLALTKTLTKGTYDFDVEMETGTGKTYVYLRSIFELHKQYGFCKFIIVVPSIAIKEGVYKSLEITKEHFSGLYDNVPYDFFIYQSDKLEQVRNFAVSDHIQIMVINIDAFRKSFEDPSKESKSNIIHRANDRLSGSRPIELIAETKPIVIIDEPQSVDTTAKSKEAIKSLNPLCTFRYSATHVDKHSLIYRLDAIDAYDLQLVKQIEVASFASSDYHNKAYLKLVSVDNSKSPITAKIEIDRIGKKGGIERKAITVRKGTDLYEQSGAREVYEGYIVADIYCEKDNEYLSFTQKDDILRLDKAVGDFDDLAVKEQQIRKTIEEHLDKELRLTKHGVKVLSLFFIDKVANYRQYDEEGRPVKGLYAQMFEKQYSDLIKQPKYNELFQSLPRVPAEQVHDGYFSIDKKGKVQDSKEGKDTQADDDAYTLIMKDKERLLSFDVPLRFIFSHSALREGWDSPNVFQICTLNETASEVKKRQEIGRGMRLCVNQDGERLHGFDINTLTVMANESYEQFAEKLQHELEAETGIKFGVLQSHAFACIVFEDDEGHETTLGHELSEQVYEFFKEKMYIDGNGKILDAMREALKNDKLEVPPEASHVLAQIAHECKKVAGGLNIKKSEDRRKVALNKKVYLSEDFKALWDRVKYKTMYSVDYDSEELVAKCSRALAEKIQGRTAKLVYIKGDLTVDRSGVVAKETDRVTVKSERNQDAVPDIVTFLQNQTSLTRKTIVAIILKSSTLELFKRHPQYYMEEAAHLIRVEMQKMLIDGIKYTRLGDSVFYAQELFESEELTGYLNRNMIESGKSVYNYVVYDSDNEQKFAEKFEANKSIKLYAKLPDWFKISTPLGPYNPDWAVLVEKDGTDKLYFVIETKGNIDELALRGSEAGKIAYGRKHFMALGQDVEFKAVDNFKRFIEEV